MTRHTRSHLLVLAMVPAVLFGAAACTDASAPNPKAQSLATHESDTPAKRVAKLHEATDWVGKFHNDALAYVFAKISRVPPKARDKRSICETARQAYAEFHRGRRGLPVPSSVDDAFEQFCAGDAGVRANVVAPSAGTPRSDISSAALALTDQIDYAVDVATSYGDLADRIYSIDQAAANDLGYEEAEAVFDVGAVALNSADYWANNFVSWIPYTSSADYSTLMTTRVIPANADAPPAFVNTGGFSWSSWATGVWNDTKAAARRAAGGDVRAAVKSVVASAMAAPIAYDVFLAGAATGSIMAVLQM